MNLDRFEDDSRRFSIVLFIQAPDFESRRAEIERLGERAHVKLVVQPCPYEGIEFLYRASVEIPEQMVSLDREVYWHALALPRETPEPAFREFSDRHYEYLLAILEQDAARVLRARKALQSLVSDRSA